MRDTTLRLVSAAAALAVLAAAGCNTIAGAGKDIKATGEAVSGSAEKTKEEISKK